MKLTNYEVTAVHGLNKYIWHKLSTGDNPVIDPARYENGLIPLIPTQQAPTFNNMTDQKGGSGGVPFIIYHSTTPALSQNFYIKMEHVMFTVYSNKTSEINAICSLIKDELHRWDYSAEDVNDYIDSLTTDPNYNDYSKFAYKAISVVNGNAGLPTNSEAGRMSGTVSLRVSYTEDTDSRLRRT
jgi:hypothetical protein